MWYADLILKMFGDIDLVFFDGYLLGNTELCWEGQEWFGSKGYGRSRAYTSIFPGGKARITLNADVLLTQVRRRYNIDISFEQIWATTLHEMIVSALRSCLLYGY